MSNETRYSRWGTYSTKRKKQYQAKIRLLLDPFEPDELIEGPIGVHYTFLLPRPKRLLGKKYPDIPVWSIVRPDYDNLAKAFQDGMNGRFFKDDSQLCHVVIDKVYTEKGGDPRVKIALTPLRTHGPK